jgi:hypothetical protein
LRSGAFLPFRKSVDWLGFHFGVEVLFRDFRIDTFSPNAVNFHNQAEVALHFPEPMAFYVLPCSTRVLGKREKRRGREKRREGKRGGKREIKAEWEKNYVFDAYNVLA